MSHMKHFFVLQILSFKNKNFHHAKLNAFWLKITVANDNLIITCKHLPSLMFQSNFLKKQNHIPETKLNVLI